MSEIKVNSVVNSTGDNDSGLDLSTNDQVIIKTANTTAVTVDSSQGVTVAGAFTSRGIDDNADAVAITIDSSENVKVGGIETSQTSPLMVKTNASNYAIYLEENSGQESWQIGVNSSGDLDFRNSGATDPAIKFNDSNSLLHSTTSELNMGANDAEGFSLLSGGVLRVSADGQSSIHAGRISNFGSVVTFACAGTGDVGSIDVTTSATSYTTSSDYRLKENVVEMTDATTRLKQLQPKRFNFIADETNTLVDGFLAHEVSSIVPEAITGEKDAVDADGNIDPQGIDQSKLVPLLVKTIQELEARITALENAE